MTLVPLHELCGKYVYTHLEKDHWYRKIIKNLVLDTDKWEIVNPDEVLSEKGEVLGFTSVNPSNWVESNLFEVTHLSCITRRRK